MALKHYQAYMNAVSQEPVDEWRGLMQASIDDTWKDSSTLETIQGQTAVGGSVYADESVYLNSVINPSTGENFGDEYRKIFYKTYADAETNKWLGKMYQFHDNYWLVTNTNTAIGAVTNSILRKCNNMLKWYDADGILHEWECVFTRNIGGTAFDYGTQGAPQVDGSCKILVQQNDETKTIPFNQRFIFDGHAFQVQQIDNHYSPTLMTIYIFETQIQSGDDLVNNIAWNNNVETDVTTETRISPNTNKILIGDSVAYSVFKYVNGVKQDNTFSISASGVLNALYTLTIVDGNHFTILAKGQSLNTLVVSCTDIQTSEVTTLKITLGGAW